MWTCWRSRYFGIYHHFTFKNNNMFAHFYVMYTTGSADRGLNVVCCVGSVQIEIEKRRCTADTDSTV